VVVVELMMLEWHCYFADKAMWCLFGYHGGRTSADIRIILTYT